MDQRAQISSLSWPPTTFKARVIDFLRTKIPALSYPEYYKQHKERPKLEPYTQEEWEYIVGLASSYKHYMSVEDQEESIPMSCLEFKHLNNNLCDKPLTVITAGQDPRIFDENKVYANKEDEAYAKIFKVCQAIRFSLQQSTLKLSTRSEQIIAHKSGHGIPDQQPELIAEVILKMLKKITLKVTDQDDISEKILDYSTCPSKKTILPIYFTKSNSPNSHGTTTSRIEELDSNLAPLRKIQ